MINSISYPVEEAEKGFLLTFPVPTDLKAKNQYILYFDAPVSLPQDPPNAISFEPSNGSYSVYGSSNFIPTVFVKIKSLHNTQTKTLIRLIIKDTNNTILYTDYVIVICYPKSVISISGKLLAYNSANTGPNGGSLLRVNDIVASSISVGSIVSGPGLDSSVNSSISKILTAATTSSVLSLSNVSAIVVGMSAAKQNGSFLGKVILVNDSSNSVALDNPVQLPANSVILFSKDNSSKSIKVKSILSTDTLEISELIGNTIELLGTYTFTTVFGCSNTKQSDSLALESEIYIILNRENNWTYTVKNQVIAQFITENDQNIVIFLPIKNINSLDLENQPPPIPEVSVIKLGGRVLNDSIPVSNI